MTLTWLPYLLAAMTAAALVRFFWIGSRQTVSVVHAVVTAGLIVGLMISINYTNGQTVTSALPDRTNRITLLPSTDNASTTLATGTAVPAEVQGAVETRDESAKLVACESALAEIAAALRRAELGGDVADDSTPTGTTEQRLSSCRIRLRAIAATLPR